MPSSIWDNQNVSSLKKEKYNLKNVSHFSVNPKYNPLMERMTDKRLKLLLLLWNWKQRMYMYFQNIISAHIFFLSKTLRCHIDGVWHLLFFYIKHLHNGVLIGPFVALTGSLNNLFKPINCFWPCQYKIWDHI